MCIPAADRKDGAGPWTPSMATARSIAPASAVPTMKTLEDFWKKKIWMNENVLTVVSCMAGGGWCRRDKGGQECKEHGCLFQRNRQFFIHRNEMIRLLPEPHGFQLLQRRPGSLFAGSWLHSCRQFSLGLRKYTRKSWLIRAILLSKKKPPSRRNFQKIRAGSGRAGRGLFAMSSSDCGLL